MLGHEVEPQPSTSRAHSSVEPTLDIPSVGLNTPTKLSNSLANDSSEQPNHVSLNIPEIITPESVRPFPKAATRKLVPSTGKPREK